MSNAWSPRDTPVTDSGLVDRKLFFFHHIRPVVRAHNRAVALCLGPYGGPRGVGVSCERGTPVAARKLHRRLYSDGDLIESSLLLLSLALSDTKVYELYVRALLGTASQICEEVVLKSRPDRMTYFNSFSPHSWKSSTKSLQGYLAHTKRSLTTYRGTSLIRNAH